MTTQQEHIEKLLERYFDATATDAEERELRAYLRETEQLPPELEYARVLFEGLDELSEERLPKQSGECAPAADEAQSLGANIVPKERPPLRIAPLAVVWGAIAATVLLAGLFVGMEHFRRPYCYIDGVAVYDKEVAMQTTVYLDGFSALETSDRMVDELIKNN